MTDYKNEYQKYADDAVRNREKEEGFGHLLKFEPQKWMVMAIMATAPLAVVLLIVNFIRLPNDSKASAPALLISLMTLVGAGATLALAKVFDLTKYL